MITGTLIMSSLAMAGGTIAMTEEEAPVDIAVQENSEWKQSITLYGWLPSFDGTLKYNIPGRNGATDETGESDIMDKLDSAFMGSYAARKNKWSFLADVIYFKMSDAKEASVTLPRRTLTVASEQELVAWVVSGYAGYNIVENGAHTINAIAGLRYLSLDAQIAIDGPLDLIDSPFTKSVEFYDGVIGVQGMTNLGESWYIPYHFDIGTGDSDFTTQASAGLGYRFGWGDVLLEYRYLYYDNGTDTLVNTLDAYGPKIGVVFHF